MRIGTGGFGLTKLFDNRSNEYNISTTAELDKAGTELQFTLIQGIPVEVKFIFNNINPQATSISRFNPWFFGNGSVSPEFRDVDF
jgi:hypothetical protein